MLCALSSCNLANYIALYTNLPSPTFTPSPPPPLHSGAGSPADRYIGVTQ